MIRWVIWLATITIFGIAAPAWAAEPVALVIEIHRKEQADARLRPAAGREWRAAETLLGLQPGDQIAVTGDARVVIMHHPGGRTETVTPKNSPFTVQAEAASAGPSREKISAALAGLAQFVLGKQGAPTWQRMASRGVAPPVILSPRHSRVFPDAVVFQWEGGEGALTLRLRDPQGAIVWEQADVRRSPVRYPAAASSLTPGVRYRWELQQGTQKADATFEVLRSDEAARVRSTLVGVNRESGYDASTLGLLRASILFDNGLFAEALRELETAAEAAPNDPTLHLLRARIYEHVGLAEHAVRAFERTK